VERDPHEQVLRRAGLSYEGKIEFSVATRWTVESLIGFAYSTFPAHSVTAPSRVGDEPASLCDEFSGAALSNLYANHH
jgi:hypothetical protein